MNFFIKSVLAISSLLTLASCSDDEPAAKYYIKYDVTADSDRIVNISYKDSSGEYRSVQTSSPDGHFSYTAGAVSKGFETEMTVSYEGGGPVRQLAISVSENGYPYVTARTISSAYSISYTIK